MSVYRTVPTYTQPLQEKGNTTSDWYRYFQHTDSGLPPANETAVVPTASPFVYGAPRKGFVIIQGGTVSAIAFSRSGPFYVTGQTAGVFPVNQNDQLQITYSGVPNVVFVPQ